MRKLIKNSIRTPDGVVLTSKHQHDFRSHRDTITDELYFTDGGLSYIRRSVNTEPYEDLSLYSDDPFVKLREHLEWGTYGKDGTEKLHYKKYKDMSNAHIEAIINDGYKGVYVEILKEELEYRAKNNILVED